MRRRDHGAQPWGDGGARVVVADYEREALARVPPLVDSILTGDDLSPVGQAVRAEILPVASHDPEVEEQYRELLGDALVTEHSDLLVRFRSTLGQGRAARGLWTVELDPDAVHAWMVVIADARRILAGLVGVTSESDWERGPDPDDPQSLLLWWLGWLQEALVQAVSPIRDLRDT